MKKIAIRVGQRWQNRKNKGFQLLITGKKDDKWLCKVLTEKTDVYAGSHRMANRTLWNKFELL